MPPPAASEEPTPIEPLSAPAGLDAWPGLEFGFAIEQDDARGDWRLVVRMCFAPPPATKPAGVVEPEPAAAADVDEAASEDDPPVPLLELYQTICGQWATEIGVTAEATFCVGPLSPTGVEMPAAILQGNARAIVAALECGCARKHSDR
ncbi:MAG TPA: hypothetical protein VG710_11875, partial [Opitutus sp.]|nr:hypothetical protein [Opitutus sp.]